MIPAANAAAWALISVVALWANMHAAEQWLKVLTIVLFIGTMTAAILTLTGVMPVLS